MHLEYADSLPGCGVVHASLWNSVTVAGEIGLNFTDRTRGGK